jgi:hypothetical protein
MLSITITKYSIELDSQKETIKQQMLSESSNEFSQFANASAQYIQSIGLPFPGTNLGVYDLQKVGLLPSTFPLTTPFGQTLIASYIADPNNSYALDVSIHTTGAISQSLAQQAGYNSQGGLSTIQYNIANQALSKIPTNLPGSNGQVFGLQNGEVITSLGSNKTQTVPSGIATSKTEVAEYILAPGQFGYWLINGSAYASETLWQVVGTNGNTANSYWFGEQYGGVGIGSQAFSLTCPSGPDIDNLGNLTTNNQNISGMREDYDSSKNNTYSMVFCVPAYKEQVQVNLNNAIYTQILNGTGSTIVNGSSGYWNGSSYIFNGGQQGVVNTNYTFVTNNMNGIVNNNLYVNGYAVTGDYAPAPHWPSNEATPYPLINYISSTGFDLVLKNPQGTNSVYQIEMNVGDLFTGSGNTQSLINLQTGIAQNYQVWNQPANGSLNDNSQENSWDGYDVTYNPSTPSGVNTSIYYYDNGTKDTLSFIVPTPVIN